MPVAWNCVSRMDGRYLPEQLRVPVHCRWRVTPLLVRDSGIGIFPLSLWHTTNIGQERAFGTIWRALVFLPHVLRGSPPLVSFPLMQCLHQLRSGRCVISCSISSCSVGCRGSRLRGLLLFMLPLLLWLLTHNSHSLDPRHAYFLS